MSIDDHCVPETLTTVLIDWSRSNPTHIPRLACFYKLLKKYIESKGRTHVLSSILPSIGKTFDKGLSSGFFNPPSVPFGCKPFGFRSRGYPSGAEPLLEIFFYSCQRRGFLLRSDVCADDVFFMRTILHGFKNVKLECSEEIKDNDKENFFALDSSLSDRGSDYTDILQSVSRFLYPLKCPDFSVDCSRHCRETDHGERLGWKPRHGPGATVDTSRSMDKYFALRNYPYSLHRIFPPEIYATHSPQEVIHVDSREIPAKLETVPKTLEKTRVITVESTAKQFCQQAVRTFLLLHETKHLRRCVDISNQELSRAAAREASIDGSTATVDLKSASDYLSLQTVSVIFAHNPPLLDALVASRSSSVLRPCGSPVYLKKFAGQGNACTFVVQSIVYATISIAAYLLTYGLKPTSRNVLKATRYIQVYGDDIILPSSCMFHLSLILQNEGLRINTEKTHHTGFFREACGGDYFQGFDVTPLYFPSFDVKFKGNERDEPELLQSLCEVSNNAYRKGLWVCSSYMRSSLPSYTHTYNFYGSLGFYSFLPFHTALKCRWNEELQVNEFLVYRIGTKRKFRESEAIWGRLYKYFVEEPSHDDKWEGRLTTKNTLVVRPEWSRIYHPREIKP